MIICINIIIYFKTENLFLTLKQYKKMIYVKYVWVKNNNLLKQNVVILFV